jgi:TM2 domain-containing membrane protein YozV
MRIVIFYLLLFPPLIFSQQQMTGIHSPGNIKKFADHLFCTRDYLRAVFEYENYLRYENDDTTKFKLALSYRQLEEYSKAADIFLLLSSKLNSQQEYFSTLLKSGEYKLLREKYSVSTEDVRAINPVKQLYLFSFLFDEKNLPPLNEYESTFSNDEEIKSLYELEADPPYRSPAAAVIMSAIIPGAGKIYTGQYGDGITAFVVTGVLAYLSWANFDAGHDFRGWLFAGLGAFFYGGNIYGSAASAQIFNAGVKISLNNELKLYLDNKNYFMPGYNFCR